MGKVSRGGEMVPNTENAQALSGDHPSCYFLKGKSDELKGPVTMENLTRETSAETWASLLFFIINLFILIGG